MHAQQDERVPVWNHEETFASIFLIVHLIRLIEFFTERTTDIRTGNNLFDSLQQSTALHIRNLVSYYYALSIVRELVDWPRPLRGINFYTREKRLVYQDIEARLSAIKLFLDSFIEIPMGVALHHCVIAMRAKLSDEALRNVYESFVNILSFEQKAHYTMPVIERFVYSDYFSS
ncbi:MAG TPA: hypothetical protein VFQ47_08010 [Nitrososphaera sp.]|nr:hypothetical protein [Nitrososphaera sp.]